MLDNFDEVTSWSRNACRGQSRPQSEFVAPPLVSSLFIRLRDQRMRQEHPGNEVVSGRQDS